MLDRNVLCAIRERIILVIKFGLLTVNMLYVTMATIKYVLNKIIMMSCRHIKQTDNKRNCIIISYHITFLNISSDFFRSNLLAANKLNEKSKTV